jgi:hypothetical protein
MAASAGEMRIIIEPETPGESRSLFRLLVGEKVIAGGMTAAQTHILIGDILEKMALPERAPRDAKLRKPK